MKFAYTLLCALCFSGCLVLAEAPTLPCDDDDQCAPFACGLFDVCYESCTNDSQCALENLCAGGVCEAVCEDSDCDNLLVCDRFNNVCLDECEVHDDCKGQKKCCKANGMANDLCDQIGTCY